MPVGCTLHCPACGRDSSFGEWFLEYDAPDGRTIRLIHPGESEHLRKLGTTLGLARRAGRIHVTGCVACADCGWITETRQLSARLPRRHS